jgi:phosphate transport system permease protein
MAGPAGHTQLSRSRRLINVLTARVVALGGAAVIAAIALIFFYLLWVVAPIFFAAKVETGQRHALTPADVLLVDANESDEIGLRITAAGRAEFFSLDDARDLGSVDLGRRLAAVQPVADHTGLYALLDETGALTLVRANYLISFVGERRQITPTLGYVFEDDWIDLGAVDAFDVHYTAPRVTIASVAGSDLTIRQYRDAEPGFALEMPRSGRLELRRPYRHVLFGSRGQWLYLIGERGSVKVLDLIRPTTPSELFVGRLAPETDGITAVAPLLGRYSLLVGDAQGRIRQWFMIRGEFGHRLERRRAELSSRQPPPRDLLVGTLVARSGTRAIRSRSTAGSRRRPTTTSNPSSR